MNLTVSKLLNYLKNKLDTDNQLQNIIVAGEISNFHHHQSGHLYFSLKDEKATISCVMFRFATNTLNFKPKNGDKVLIKANTSIFEASGQLQLYVSLMKLDGIGDLFIKFEKLKAELNARGLFEEQHKKPKPDYPMNIAVLVGDKSAALSDIKTNFLNRWPMAKVSYFPVLVQGKNASEEITNTLLDVDKEGYDAIILARGGGSFEDLFAFNDESLAYAIYNLKTFIITGIGHEQDFTIADFVADLRAPTPTAAVVMLTPDIKNVLKELNQKENQLSISIRNKIGINKDRLKRLNNSKVFTVDKYLLQDKILKIEFLKTKLYNSVKDRQNLIHDLSIIKHNLRTSISNKIALSEQKIEIGHLKSKQLLKLKFEQQRSRLKRLTTLLEAYSFENVLKRGYSLILKDDKIIRRKSDLIINEEYQLKMYDGIVSIQYKEDLSCQKKNSKNK